MTMIAKTVNQLLDWDANAELAALPAVEPGLHKAAMRHMAAAVCIVTARDAEGARLGLTATAVCSVTAEPPRLVVFVNKNVAADAAMLATGALCVNVLSGDQEHEAKVFAGMIEGVYGEARFEHGTWSELASSAPALDGALANLDCRVVKVYEESTHHAFLCEVLAVRERADGEALVYLNGAFHRLPQ